MYRVIALTIILIATVGGYANAGERFKKVAGYDNPTVHLNGLAARDLIYCQDRLLNTYRCAQWRDYWNESLDLDRNIGGGLQSSRKQFHNQFKHNFKH